MRPAYQVYKIDLSQRGSSTDPTKGREIIHNRGNLLRFIYCTDVSGAFSADGSVEIVLGLADADRIPLTINGRIAAEVDGYQIFWTVTATPLIAVFLVANNVAGAEVDIDAPPAKQLVTTASGSVLATGAGVLNSVARLILPASASRVKATILNTGSTLIRIGPASITYFAGFPLMPGGAFELSGTTAAVYGATATAGTYATLTEG